MSKPNCGYISEAILALGQKASRVPDSVVDEATYKAQVEWVTALDEATDTATTAILDNPPVSWADVDAKVTALKAKDAIMDKIEALEAEVTPRRIRDAFADPTWMNAQEAKIKTERDKL